MANKTPLQRTKELHGSKENLVEKLLGLVERGEESREDLKARLLKAQSSKLLRLHETLSAIQERFGGKDKLVDTILAAKNRVKDQPYRDKLLTLSPGRLIDLARVSRRKQTPEAQV